MRCSIHPLRPDVVRLTRSGLAGTGSGPTISRTSFATAIEKKGEDLMTHMSVSAAGRTRGLASRSTAVAMAIASGSLLALMVLRGHAIGGEIWGPIAGIMALAASILTFAVHRSSGRVGRSAIVLL